MTCLADVGNDRYTQDNTALSTSSASGSVSSNSGASGSVNVGTTHKSNTGAVAGGVVGGVLGVLFVLVLGFFIFRRRMRKRVPPSAPRIIFLTIISPNLH